VSPLGPTHPFHDLLILLLWLSLASLVAAVILGVVIWRRLRRLVTSGGGFWQTLREVPWTLVVFIDLLDLGLESFSAPIIWFLLRRLGLTALREVATVEALIPFSGPVPTMTICWLLARVKKGGQPILGRRDWLARGALEGEQVAPGRWRARPRGG
jgi:hypothetical protein